MAGAESPAPAGVDVSKPSPARMYDYLLGGRNNFAADRGAAEQVIAAIGEEARTIPRVNRAFLGRAVRFLAGEAGIRQFIDLGTGLPTQGNVPEVLREVAPDSRVTCVDYDPIVVAHARALLAGAPNAAVVQADLRRPGEILDHPTLQEMIDLDRPVAVLFVAILHFVPDSDDPAGIVERFREAVAPGSYLALSHVSGGAIDPDSVKQAERAYDTARSPLVVRTPEEIRGYFSGLELVEPGFVDVSRWRPAGETAETRAKILGGVAQRT